VANVNLSGVSNQFLTQAISGLTVGENYVVQYDYNVTSGRVRLNGSLTGIGTQHGAGTSGTDVFYAVASGTSHALQIQAIDDGTVATINNISVKLADADRSVNNNGLIVNGTVTRTPVATGADLVAYSGFSTSNYLEQPYNPDLDFGTGDFCIMGWVNLQNNTGDHILERGEPGSIANRFGLFISGSEIRPFVNTSILSGGGASFGAWDCITMVRRSGVLEFYRGGVLKASQADTNDVTNANAALTIGAKSDTTNALTNGSLALLRISATAPTAEQIAKIYNDEKVLFQENAQATLYGASDAVTALAYDPDTDLLHVGTSAGRSVFDGPRRVGNTTTSVSTAISATGGLVVEK